MISFFRTLSRTPGVAVVLILASFAANLLMLTGPLFMLQVYDRVLASRSIPTLVALTTLVGILFAFYALIDWLRLRMMTRYAAMLDEELSTPLFKASLRQRLVPGAKLPSDAMRDIDSLRAFVAGPGPVALLDLPWLPVYLAIVFVFHPVLGWLAVGGALAISLLLVINELLSSRPMQQANEALLVRQSQADDARASAESIAAMGMTSNVSARWATAAGVYAEAQERASDRAALYLALTKSFRLFLQSATLAVGAYLAIQGSITGGMMVTASILTARALAPIEQVVGVWRSFVAARQADKRIRVTLMAFGEPPAESDLLLPLPSISLSVSQLATGPLKDRKPIVTGVTFSLKAGEGLGILGLSGSGKSSLIRAIVGIWPVLQGEVRLDGSALAHFDRGKLGSTVGYLPQSVELFGGTVGQNIARFDPEATMDKILAAAKAAGVHGLVAALDNGYASQVGERGQMLSAGQRQRIGLARALYNDPFLIVLDEPNSNLDAEGDAALTAALREARNRGAIVIVVAHRPSAVAAVDTLLFMRDGRQQAFGPKDEVLRLVTQQPQLVANVGAGVRQGG